MQGLNQRNHVRSRVAKFVLGGAMSCLLAAPAAAQGYASPVSWSGPYASVGIGAVFMDADAKVNAARDGAVNVDVFCQEYTDYVKGHDTKDGESYKVSGCPISKRKKIFVPGGTDILSATLFPLLQQQILQLDGSSDAGVMGTVSLGWDFQSGNFVFGPFVSFDFFDVESEFSSQVWAEGGKPSIEFFPGRDCGSGSGAVPCQEVATNNAQRHGHGIKPFIVGGIIGASVAHAIRDEHIEIDGKIEQDYALQVGGRMGYVWNDVFMTYFGAAWTRTSIDGHVNINIADPLCGGPEGSKLCGYLGDEHEGVDLANTPTNIRLDLDEEVDGYKLLIGGEYFLGHMLGGNIFLRGQAEYQDYDGITESFSGSKNQQVFSSNSHCWKHERKAVTTAVDNGHKIGCKPAIDVTRLINESASASIDKEDYSVHAAVVYKLGGGQ